MLPNAMQPDARPPKDRDIWTPEGRHRVSGETRAEERINMLMHLVGLVLAIGGTATMISLAGVFGSAWHVVSFSIYGGTLVLIYGISTLYHGLHRPRTKRLLRVADHIGIFLFIAGTYTPFALVALNGGWGWSIFGVVWGLAGVGIVLKIFFTGRFDLLSTLLYIGLGWVVLVAIVPLVRAMPLGGLLLLVAGGLAYTGGAAFYMWERLPFSHAVWHGFVLLGSCCHFFAVLLYLLPHQVS